MGYSGEDLVQILDTVVGLGRLRVAELKTLLQFLARKFRRRLPISGNKGNLVQRLESFLASPDYRPTSAAAQGGPNLSTSRAQGWQNSPHAEDAHYHTSSLPGSFQGQQLFQQIERPHHQLPQQLNSFPWQTQGHPYQAQQNHQVHSQHLFQALQAWPSSAAQSAGHASSSSSPAKRAKLEPADADTEPRSALEAEGLSQLAQMAFPRQEALRALRYTIASLSHSGGDACHSNGSPKLAAAVEGAMMQLVADMESRDEARKEDEARQASEASADRAKKARKLADSQAMENAGDATLLAAPLPDPSSSSTSSSTSASVSGLAANSVLLRPAAPCLKCGGSAYDSRGVKDKNEDSVSSSSSSSSSFSHSTSNGSDHCTCLRSRPWTIRSLAQCLDLMLAATTPVEVEVAAKEEAHGPAPTSSHGVTAAMAPTASEVAAARASRRQVLRLVLLERKAVQWYPQPAKCALTALARRFEDAFTDAGVLVARSASVGNGCTDRAMEEPLPSRSSQSAIGCLPADLGKMATFLESEANAFESGLYALPTVSGSRLPDILLPYANVTFDESGHGCGNGRASSGAADAEDDEVEVVAPPSSAAPAAAPAPVVAPDVICIED